MVMAELLHGALKSDDTVRARGQVLEFLSYFEILPFDDAAAEAYALIRVDLEKRGEVIGANDMIIAATTLSGEATLVSNNTREFSRIPGLAVTDWTEN